MTKTFSNFEGDRYLQCLTDCGDSTGKLGYAIAKNKRKISAELTEYTDKKNEAIKTHGKDLGDGRIGVTSADELIAVNNDLKDIGQEEITVDILTVDEKELEDSGLTAKQMEGLFWMINED